MLLLLLAESDFFRLWTRSKPVTGLETLYNRRLRSNPGFTGRYRRKILSRTQGSALTTHCLNARAIVRRLFSQFQACDALSGPSEAPGSSKTGFFYVSLFDLRIPRANDSIPRDTSLVSKPNINRRSTNAF